MRRLAIGSVAIVLLASLQCESQETKVAPLTRLRQTSILIEDLTADGKTIGLSEKSLESQMLVGLRRDIPRLAVRENARPYLYLNVNVGRLTIDGGREIGFSACVSLQMVRPVWIQEDVGFDEVTFTMATVWDKATHVAGTRRDIRQLVKESIDEALTQFAADYYRQNPQ
jgi:hypothetical protein